MLADKHIGRNACATPGINGFLGVLCASAVESGAVVHATNRGKARGQQRPRKPAPAPYSC